MARWVLMAQMVLPALTVLKVQMAHWVQSLQLVL
jgi:hypothetical protein